MQAMLASGTCRKRHRVPSGVRFAPSLCDRLRRPPGTLVQETATGRQPASIHAGMLPADPLPFGGSLRSRRFLFRLSFTPVFMGGETGRFALGGSGSAALLFIPLRPQRGDGRKRKEGYRGLSVMIPHLVKRIRS